jgi:hypothetical protein
MADPIKLFPVGESLAQIKFVDFEVSSKKGTPLVNFKLEGSAGEAKGLAIRNRCYLTDNSLWKIEDFAVACGVDAAAAVALSKASDPRLLRLFIGKEVKVVVKADSYTDNKGIEREGREIIAIESLDAKIRSHMERKREARQSGGTLREKQPVAEGAELVANDKAAASKPAAAGKPPANRTASSVGEDEIPF